MIENLRNLFFNAQGEGNEIKNKKQKKTRTIKIEKLGTCNFFLDWTKLYNHGRGGI